MGLFGSTKKESREAALPVTPEQIYAAGALQLQDILSPSALQIRPTAVQLGEKFARTIFIFSYPRYLNTNWFSPIIVLDKVFDIAMHIHPVDTTDILKTLRRKVTQVQSQIAGRQEKGLVRDPILDTAYQDLEELRDKLQQAQERLFNFGLYLTIYANTEKELDTTEAELKTTLESRLVYTKPALFQQTEGFQSVLPLGYDNLNINTYMNSSPVSSTFPFVSFDLTSNRGILYGINRHNNSLILYDRYSLPNHNAVVFGVSGGGKSYVTKLEIMRQLMWDVDVIVIDPENEYKYLAEAVGGSFINISLTSQSHVNPFDLPVGREDESQSDILRSNIVNLVGLFRIMLGGLTPIEDSLLEEAIRETYASRDITPESDFSQITPPTLSDLEMVLSSIQGAENLAIRLKKYTTGTWSGFLNQPTNIDVSNRLVVFSVRDMEDELRPVGIFLVLHYVWNVVRSSLKKRLLIVDEAWWLMKNEDGGSFLFGIAKRARKYYLGLTTITQDVSDFMNSQYGRPIVTNSSIQMLFKQSPATINAVTEHFNLTEEERFLLLESERGEGIFFVGLKHAAISVRASYTEDQIITSDPAQLLMIKKAKQEFAETQSPAPQGSAGLQRTA